MSTHIKELNSKTPDYKQKLQHDVQKSVDNKNKINPKEIFEHYKGLKENKKGQKKKKPKKKY